MTFSRTRRYLVAVVATAGLALTATACQPGTVLVDAFDQPDTLITNERAYHSPTMPGVKHSDRWEMTSGSLFVRNQHGWTGRIDDQTPDALSKTATNSAIFRLVTKNKTYRNVDVHLDLRHEAWASTSKTPAVPWDGAHVFLRYESQRSLYYASINRRDGAVVIKKKVPGGPSNGGTYHTLASARRTPATTNQWQTYTASIADQPNGSVRITIRIGDTEVLSATDSGTGGPAIRRGGVGLRGDNAQMSFDNFRVIDHAKR